ncbi:RNA pyrophosphohydrolase [Minwuia sp.]|uniref:RNA pyrophosphohydrolase n=1 Tax=Minwuia sp. TaxID=2493630 RepID=UPI003A8D6C3F
MNDLPYRPCAGIMLVNADWQVFVGRRIDQRVEAWQMPQGGIDEGETPSEAALRELEEEVGTSKAEIVAESTVWINYDLPPDLVGKVWKGRYRGQTQKWFLLRFTGQDSDIDIQTAHPEFDAWRWSPLSQVVDMAIAFKRDSYTRVVAEFAPYFPDDRRLN